jgi:hypothetical protein
MPKQKSCSNLMEALYQYCKNINDWPASWEIVEEDIVVGEVLTEQFKLFLLDRIEKEQAKKTIKTHAQYLWVLGGELIRKINEDEDDAERRLSAKELILKYSNYSPPPSCAVEYSL